MALGSVSVPTFTRAEFDTMLKKAMYSDGEVVWTGAVYTDAHFTKYESSSVSVPDEVDYISVAGTKMIRGDGYCMLSGTAYLSNGTKHVTCRVTFDSDGKLTVYGCAESIGTAVVYFNVIGYHYY